MLSLERRLKFVNMLYKWNCDIICLTETWLTSTVESSFVFPYADYTVLARSDRKNGEHGGSLIAIKGSIPSTFHIQPVVCESPVGCAVLLVSASLLICIAVIYNPPASSHFRLSVISISEFLETAHIAFKSECAKRGSLHDSYFLVSGDMNLPNIDWYSCYSSSSYDANLLSLFHDYDLEQHIFEPTHCSGSILDILLLNRANPGDIEVLESDFSDHKPVSITFPTKSDDEIRPVAYSKSSFDYTTFSVMLNSGYNALQYAHLYDDFSVVIFSILNESVRVSSYRKRLKRQNLPFYYSSHTVHLLNKLGTQKKRNPMHDHSTLVDRLNVSMELDKVCFLQSYETMDVNSCFKILKSLSNSSPYPGTMHFAKRSASTTIEKANLFNDFFASVFKTSGEIQITSLSTSSTIELCKVSVSHEKVLHFLQSANDSASVCCDDVPPAFLKHCAFQLSPLVAALYEDILKRKKWPDVWKTAYITPLYKKDSHSDVSNYRPISLLPKLSLGLERILFDYIYTSIRPKITKYQSGFMSRRSTVTQLLNFCDELYRNHELGISSFVFYVDIKKAFDSVPHHKLLKKLADFGLDVSFLQLLKSYLSGRFQRVRINGVLSDFVSIMSGVPQGSILGPLLFLLFVNDLPDYLLSKPSLFADDLKCCSTSVPVLQRDLDAVINWCGENSLDLHPDKCKVLKFFNHSSENPDLYIGDHKIDESLDVKDLGIIFSSDLSWSHHVSEKLFKCNKVYFMLKRNVPSSTPRQTKVRLYKACILSVLTYGSSIWIPNKTDLSKLEAFNRRCVRWIGLSGDYKTSLIKLGIYPLPYHIEISNLLFFHKLFQDKYDLNPFDFVDINDPSVSLRSVDIYSFKLKKRKYEKTKSFYFDRIPRLLNFMKLDVRLSFPRYKREVMKFYDTKLRQTFEENIPCTWYGKCCCTFCRS